MKSKNLRYRMYSLVLTHLNQLQKGIQAYHSAIQYSLKYKNSKEYDQWARKDKTVIILNGGSSNQKGTDAYSRDDYIGTLDEAIKKLTENKIKHHIFYEPDINNTITAIALLVDEKVWNKKDYPDLPEKVLEIIPGYDPLQKKHIEKYKYTKEQLFLKDFLKEFKLAN